MLQRAETAARRNFSRTGQVGEPRCGVSAAGLLPPFGGAIRAEAEHELAPSRAVFFPLPACRLRGVTGYYLRGHPEVFKKPLPTQVPTRRGSAARTAFKYTPLAAGGDEQTFGANQQVPHARGCYQSGDGSVAQFPRCEPRSPPCGLTLPVFYRPLAASRSRT